METYKWNFFPVDFNNFHVLIVSSMESQKNIKLIEYFKKIFPTSFLFCDTTIDFEKELEIKNNSHSIVYGRYNDIPSSILSISDIIVFDNTDDINKYLSSRYLCIVEDFDFNNYNALVDKKNIALRIYGLSKFNATY